MSHPIGTVVLLEAEAAGLIVLERTGVFYETQTGGYACFQDRAEGFYVPLSHQVVDHSLELHRYFSEELKGACTDGIGEETAGFIDAELRRLPGHSGITVDRTRLAESRESWVYVTIAAPSLGLMFGAVSINRPLAAILCWPNSD